MKEIPIPAGLERRKEDYELITGQGYYVDDLKSPREHLPVLLMVMVRSPYAHARIKDINLEAARALPGVVAALSGAELVKGMPTLELITALPGLKIPERRPLALDRVRYVGDPVAVVLAENRYIAEDARDLVEVDYEELPAVIDPEAALAPDAPLLYEELGSNIAIQLPGGGGDIQAAFMQADQIVHLRVVNQRVSPGSLEGRACLFDFDATTGQLSAWLSSQTIYQAHRALAHALGLDRGKIRVYNAQVGGAFGAKVGISGEELVAALLAVKHERPVKWIETRSENLQAQTHGRGQVNYIEAAVQKEGRLLGLKVRTVADFGAFLAYTTPISPNTTARMLNGPYQIQALDFQAVGVFTNTVPTAAYRGAGRPEAAYLLERTMDGIAHELHLDPAEVRRRNLIATDAFPYRTVHGALYDSGNYQATLDQVLDLVDYAGWRAKQQERRKSQSSRLLGIGLSTFVEISGGPFGPTGPGIPQDAATVRIRRDGTILVQSGVAHNGQGYFTAFAQLAAQTFDLPGSQVEVQMNDTALPAYSIGTFGSRTVQISGVAVLLAAQAAREKALQAAAQLLEAAPTDLEMTGGQVKVRGVPGRAITLGDLARQVEEQPDLIEHDPPNPFNGTPIEGLAAWHQFSPSGPTFSSGAHVAVVEVETETGEVRVLSYVAVDDCGRILNSYLTEAQIHGGLAQGIGQALYEEVVYDQNGQPLAGTLMDYTLPNAEQIPDLVVGTVETPSPLNPLEAKGAGEAGCIGGPPTIVNAVLDALAPLGIEMIDMPMRPEKVWALVQAARQGTLQRVDPVPPAVFHVTANPKQADTGHQGGVSSVDV
ncbi:MAG: xanthine dehydrogenase family protein molybdopterin-binding subunit [Chloroflexota bacterium]|nr:xanthine dehydrogenase family protein molybdopterin-binding subunit [Chloroflexota bacterium]